MMMDPRPPRNRTAARNSPLGSAEFYVCRNNDTPSVVAKACNVNTDALLFEVRAPAAKGPIWPSESLSISLSLSLSPRP